MSIIVCATIVLIAALAVLAVIDQRTQRLPDLLTLPLIAGGLLMAATERGAGSLLAHDLAALWGFAALWFLATSFERVAGRAGLGLGDAKLMAVAGAWLGPLLLAPVLLIASSAALLISLLFMRRSSASATIAFGPYLSAAIAGGWIASLPSGFSGA